MTYDSEVLSLIEELSTVERAAAEDDVRHTLRRAVEIRKRLRPGQEPSDEEKTTLDRAEKLRRQFLFGAQVWARIEDDILSANRMIAAGCKHTERFT